jgi:hypothetical protein
VAFACLNDSASDPYRAESNGGQENGTYFNRSALYSGIDDVAMWTMENL